MNSVPCVLLLSSSLIAAFILAASGWRIFTKARQKGWAFLVPVYNVIILLEILKKPGWWIVLLFIPVINFAFIIFLIAELVLAFGKPASHVIAAVFGGVFYFPYLAFSKATFRK